MLIRGIDITLFEKTQNGVDALGNPTFEELPVTVHNVLVMPVSTVGGDMPENTTLTGKGQIYNIGIPKGDTHNWTDSRVEFLGGKFKTFGFIEEGIEANVPGAWHKKISCERYE